jgi:AcrR family transcriptional regulator
LATEAEVVGAAARGKPRIVKPADVRRGELIDCAQGLFLTRGYERTTVNDVIAATGLSKGAFYHHFRAKEDLLEAIAARFSAQAVAEAVHVQADPQLSALERLNLVLAMAREWKGEHMPQLRAMFTTLLKPENAMLYHRIVGAVFQALAPMLTAIIEAGQAAGQFAAGDARLAAEALLWLGDGRRALVVRGLEMADAGDLEGGARLIIDRVRAEEALVDRILGLPAGSISLAGSDDYVRGLLEAWQAAPEAAG